MPDIRGPHFDDAIRGKHSRQLFHRAVQVRYMFDHVIQSNDIEEAGLVAGLLKKTVVKVRKPELAPAVLETGWVHITAINLKARGPGRLQNEASRAPDVEPAATTHVPPHLSHPPARPPELALALVNVALAVVGFVDTDNLLEPGSGINKDEGTTVTANKRLLGFAKKMGKRKARADRTFNTFPPGFQRWLRHGVNSDRWVAHEATPG